MRDGTRLLLRRIAGWSILAVFAGWCALFVARHADSFARVLTLQPAPVALLCLLTVAGLVVNGLLLRVTLAAYERTISLHEGFAVSATTALGNLVTPFSGGLGARALYLQRVHGLSLARFTGSLAGTYLLNLMLLSLVAGGVLAVIALAGEPLDPWLLAFTALLSLGSLGALLGGNRLARLLPHPLRAVIESWETIRRDRPRLTALAGLLALNLGLSALALRCSFAAFGAAIRPGAALYLTVLASLGTMLSLTPGSLGVAEALLLVGARFFGIAPEDVLLAALVGRAAQLPTILVLGLPYSLLLARRFSRTVDSS